ncbi:MAG: aldose 1-epimerase family protein [Actinomycetes bacterium]
MTVAGARADGRTSSTLALPPSGTQHVLEHGDQRAVVTQVGATLREYTVGGRAVLDGFGVEERATDGRGQVLAPWPNRLTAGRYVFGGQVAQAALSEPARSGAIHGLVRWQPWTELERGPSEVTLGCVLHPQPGYEWRLELQVGYRLGDDGLTVTCEVTNVDRSAAPFGIGFHPYLTLGVPVDELQLRLPAHRVVQAGDPDAEPTLQPLAGTAEDFLVDRAVGATVLDTAYADLERGADGRAVATISDASGRGVALWVDERFRYLMVYTADRVTALSRRRRAIAVEPMTCPPDALRSGTDLVVLEPGASWRAAWGIRSFADERGSQHARRRTARPIQAAVP